MKPHYLAVAVLSVSAFCCVTANDNSRVSDNFAEEIVVELLERIFYNGLLSTDNINANIQSDIAGLLPPLPDPLPIAGLALGAFNLSNAEIHGLSKLTDNITIGEPLITVTIDLDMPDFSSNGSYQADLELEAFGSILHITGAGEYLIRFYNFSIDLGLRINVNTTSGGISINETTLIIASPQTGSDTFFENMEFNGNPTEWSDPGQINAFGQMLLGALNKPTVPALIEGLLNNLLKDCTLHGLISGDLSCTGLVAPPPTVATTSPAPEDSTPNSGVYQGPLGLGLLAMMTSFLLIVWH